MTHSDFSGFIAAYPFRPVSWFVCAYFFTFILVGDHTIAIAQTEPMQIREPLYWPLGL
jgi:hypothetical protein